MNRPKKTEQILDDFAAELSHDRETLDRYISKFPEIRVELLELASEIRLVSDDGRFAPEVITDSGADSAWDLFAASGTTARHNPNPFSNFRGKQFADLSDRLGVPRGFMVGIRDKRTRLESIPERFLAAASKAMEIAMDDLRAYFSGEPVIPIMAEFKADQKPTVIEQVTFEQLVVDTVMSDKQRKTALGYLDDD